MGQSTEELSGDIATTRQSLASDLDALQDRVSPSAIVERRKQAARSRVGGIRDKVMGTALSAKDSVTGKAQGAAGSALGAVGGTQDRVQDSIQGSPLGAGLVAFGAGMVIAALLPASDKEARAGAQLVATAQDKAQPLVEQAKSAGQDVAHNLAESAAEAAQEVKETATEGAQRVKSEGQSAAESVQSEVKKD